MGEHQPYYTIRTRRPADGNASLDGHIPGVNGAGDGFPRTATHDISRTSFHVKHIGDFAQRLEDSATRAFPNRGRTSQRYQKVQSLLLHWGSDDLFVLPELEDLEKCLRVDFAFATDIFAIPSENSHLELMMRVCQLIKEHESQDTLFVVYYGGHARIDESRQSTWCATRDQSSPWLQWSAIQTLLERSKSDVLILLDCCAGAASATFPNGNSITETISASSWDAIAPDPGRYSFTNALIEVLQEWRMRTFSAAMLHAEVLARLKHPRPVTLNGKHFEARSTPVHFMMTANHKAPSIELSRLVAREKIPEPVPEPAILHHPTPPSTGRAADPGDPFFNGSASGGPNEDIPHVMISLALEDDQQLDVKAWEQWLGAFPSMAKYVKVQGVFKSHSTLMLVSLPVMIWDLLPDDPAVSFIAFIRSNNLAIQARPTPPEVTVPVSSGQQNMVTDLWSSQSSATGGSGATFAATENIPFHHDHRQRPRPRQQQQQQQQQQQHDGLPPSYGITSGVNTTNPSPSIAPLPSQSHLLGELQWPYSPRPGSNASPEQSLAHTVPVDIFSPRTTPLASGSSAIVPGQMIMNQQQAMRRTDLGENVPEPKKFSEHIERRLEEYYQEDSMTNDAYNAFIASNLGIELWHLEVWLHHRRERDLISDTLAALTLKDMALASETVSHEPRMILPAELSRLLELSLPGFSLIFDVRSALEYRRSHVHGAINLRAPRSFLQAAPLDLIERAIPSEQGRRQWSQLSAASCLVFYGRGLETSWECPAAELITHKLRKRAWIGHCFILRGHYREFSQSFDKHIVTDNMAQPTKDQVGSQVNASPGPGGPNGALMQHQYASWLEGIVGKDQARPLSTLTAWTPERREAFEMREKDLEAEFKARCGPLFSKVMCMQTSSSPGRDILDTKAEMVGPLDRGLEKIRDLTQPSPDSHVTRQFEPAPENMSDGHLGKVLHEKDVDDEYVEISKSKSRHHLPRNQVEQQRRV